MSPRTGRPKVDHPRNIVRSVHLTTEELAKIEAAAKAQDKPVTVYIRDRALGTRAKRPR